MRAAKQIPSGSHPIKYRIKGMIKHPNVTQEILEQLTDSEYKKIAEFAKEKLQQFE